MDDAFTIATFLAAVGDIFTKVISWVGTVATTIAGQPILLCFCALPLVGLGVGLFKRLISAH